MSSPRSTNWWRGWECCLQSQFLDHATVVNLNRTKRFLFDLKCTEIAGGWGSAPDPAGELTALPQLLDGLGGEESGEGGERRGKSEERGGGKCVLFMKSQIRHCSPSPLPKPLPRSMCSNYLKFCDLRPLADPIK